MYIRPSRCVRPVAVVILCPSARPVIRSSSVRASRRVPSSPSLSSVRPSGPSSIPSSSSVLCPSVPVCPAVVDNPLSVRPVVRLIITYLTSRSMRRLGIKK